MQSIKKQSIDPEQEICLKCGFCCDGTLFNFAEVEPGEKDSLPEKIRENYYVAGKNERFRLPCQYFTNLCVIYNQPRVLICGKYRCQLLYDFSANKIGQVKAFEIIEQARTMKLEILNDYSLLFKGEKLSYFRELYVLSGEENIYTQDDKASVKLKELFFAKCTIFEALMTRYFKSRSDFQGMSNK